MNLDVHETDRSFEITADVPGARKEDVQVELLDGAVRLSATRQHSEERRDGPNVLSERSYGSVSRVVRLPTNVNEEDVTAKYENGVLHVTFGKKVATPRRVVALQ